MTVASEQLQLPEQLKDLILSKKCVAFIGSGLSAGCYDSWFDLVNRLCERCGSSAKVERDHSPEKLLEAVQDAKDTNESSYYAFLGEHFGRPAQNIPRPYLAMMSLPFQCYLTINVDPLLALVGNATNSDRPVGVCAYPSLDRKKMTPGSIHYLHGYIADNTTPKAGTVVLTRCEFEEAYAANSNLMAFLSATLVEEAIVFVGCRLKEPTMPRVFQICKEQQDERQKLCATGRNTPPPKLIVLPKLEIENSRGEIDVRQSEVAQEKEDTYYSEELHITPVRYPAPKGDHSALWGALEQLGNLAKIRADHGFGGGGYAR